MHLFQTKDGFFGDGPAWYHDVSIEIPLSHGFTLAGHYGWNRFDDSAGNHEDYKVGISKEYLGLGLAPSWVHRLRRSGLPGAVRV